MSGATQGWPGLVGLLVLVGWCWGPGRVDLAWCGRSGVAALGGGAAALGVRVPDLMRPAG
ncbi:MAG: hypothetical protein M3Y48_05935 [Actinomycetota bacterium]|nr:hypothetical protein [Actinomycetota bacterium]